MASSSLVDFRGNWPPGEQELIKTAVEETEAAGFPDSSDDLIAPWVVVRKVMGTTSLYMASRQGEDEGLLGRSAGDLADRIRDFAERQTGAPVASGRADSNEVDGPALFQLVYESKAAASMSEKDVRTLLQKARSKNEKLEITGLLLYADGRFLQVLEGPEPVVRDLYTTVQEDPRHTHVETLYATPISRRTFPDWKMGLENLTAIAGEEATSEFLQTGTLEGAAEPMSELIRALDRFKQGRSLKT